MHSGDFLFDAVTVNDAFHAGAVGRTSRHRFGGQPAREISA